MDNNNFDPNVMQQLMQMYKEGKIPNMNPNANQNPNMGGMNPNMGGMNQNMEMFNMFFNQMMMNGGMPFIPPPFMNFQIWSKKVPSNSNKNHNKIKIMLKIGH